MEAGFNKVFMKLADEEVILHTMRAFEANKDVDEIIVVIGEDDKERVTNIAEAAPYHKTQRGNCRRRKPMQKCV